MSLPRSASVGAVVAALGVFGPALPAGGQSAAAGEPVPGPPNASDAWTALIRSPVAARAAPRVTARIRARLERVTEYWRRPQRLLVLSPLATDDAGREWVRVRLPGRPNGASGWIPLRALTLRMTRTSIRVSVSERTLELWRAGELVRRFPSAVGTARTPTPTGLFAIHDYMPSASSQRDATGPYILTLTAHSPVLRSFQGGDGLVAIHGTGAPGSLGTAASFGCVRVANGVVRHLYRIVSAGMPVTIVP